MKTQPSKPSTRSSATRRGAICRKHGRVHHHPGSCPESSLRERRPCLHVWVTKTDLPREFWLKVCSRCQEVVWL